MLPRILLPALASILLLIPSVSVSCAATATVKDGATLELAGGNTFRLDGIDAPAVDQMCIDEHADPWACGVEARDQLVKLVGGNIAGFTRTMTTAIALETSKGDLPLALGLGLILLSLSVAISTIALLVVGRIGEK